MGGLVLNFVTLAGIVSGVAILLTLLRRSKRRVPHHSSKDCVECRSGFLCKTARIESGSNGLQN